MHSMEAVSRATVQEQHDGLGLRALTGEAQAGSTIHGHQTKRQTCDLTERLTPLID